MSRSNSNKAKYAHAKGGAFERKVFRDLRESLADVADFPVVRTLGSGGSEDDADIKSVGGFLIEAKHWKKLTEADLKKFWKKLCAQAEKKGMKPALIYKENYRNEKVVFMMPSYFGRWKVTIDYVDWKEWLKGYLDESGRVKEL